MRKILSLLFCFLFVFPLLAWAMKCPKCEANNGSSSKFCIKCGTNLYSGSANQSQNQASVSQSINIPKYQLKGPKKTIGVLSFENKTNFFGEVSLGDDFSDQLTHALMQTGKFNVLVRKDLNAVITEQDLAASDRFSISKAATKGELIPAQIIIKGVVSEFEAHEQGGDHNIDLGNFGIGDIGLCGKIQEAHMAVIVYIIDTATGQVLDSQRVAGHANSGGLGVNYSYSNKVSLSSEGFKKTPLGTAAQNTIQLAVNYIAEKLANVPWSGNIVKVENNIVYLNAGKNIGIKAGDIFNIYSEGEALIDPVTGEQLGSDKIKLGKLTVTDVQDKFSKATILEASNTVKRGDLIMVD